MSSVFYVSTFMNELQKGDIPLEIKKFCNRITREFHYILLQFYFRLHHQIWFTFTIIIIIHPPNFIYIVWYSTFLKCFWTISGLISFYTFIVYSYTISSYYERFIIPLQNFLLLWTSSFHFRLKFSLSVFFILYKLPKIMLMIKF